ncbi:MAG TPA: ATPase domain-containing protein, partial [Kofleriaceae bacterium]|nr:ATPase domain-containing protein [Kofleriaceae bacterium]
MGTEERPDGPLSTGIAGLDLILGGGLPRDRLFLLQGEPGVGKTTIALQFLMDGAARGERVLYITLSETEAEIADIARSHGWSLDCLALMELSDLDRADLEGENSIFEPSEVDLRETTQALIARIEEVTPTRVVFDSLSELRLLAQGALRFRRQILSLKQYFTTRKMTVLLLDDRSGSASDLQLESIVHGVIRLHQDPPEFGEDRRRLRVMKLRGVKFRGGYHEYNIHRGGVEVYPRLVAAEHHAAFVHDRLSSGIAGIDALLGGGVDRGTSTLVIGPPGTGKSALASQYACAAARRGEGAVIFAFDEARAKFLARSRALGMDLDQHIDSGRIAVHQIDAAELGAGEFVHRVRDAVEQDGARIVVIDSINGFFNSMPSEPFVTAQVHELLSYLGQLGATTFVLLAPSGLVG